MRSFSALATALILSLGCGGSPAATTATGTAAATDEPPAVGPDNQPAERPQHVAVGKPNPDLIPRTVFFGDPDRSGVQISPDGKHLSWRAQSGGVMNVWVAPTSDLGKAVAVTDDKERPISTYFWAADSKHVIYLQDTGGDENWNVFAVDVATKKRRKLTPSKKKVQARILRVSHKRPVEIVIAVNDRNPQLHDPYLVNIATGESKLLMENPGFLDFTINDDLEIVIGGIITPAGGVEYKVRGKSNKKKAKKAGDAEPEPDPFEGWKTLLAVGPEDVDGTSILGFDKSGRNMYMWDSRNRDTRALTLASVKTGRGRVIAKHPKADGSGVFVHPITKKVLAVSFTHARREWKVLDRGLKKDLAVLEKINDGELEIVDSTLDLGTWVVIFHADDGPVRYYLYDRATRKAKFLFTNRVDLEKRKLAKMHSKIIKARDGLELVSYLTLPVSADADGDQIPDEPLPAVLWVHGGPWARDHWGYNPVHQLFANRGYAVLSVNFRGSTGFGKKFLNAANGQWGKKMHDDLIDAVKWAVDQKIFDESKVCIGGGSYGGYATLAGLTLTPDVFACGVDIVGPSSIITLIESVPPYWKPVLAIFKTRIGDWTTEEGKKALLEVSPISRVDEITRPLLIGQGANDPRVKQAESDQIVGAMQEKKIPVSYVLFPDEGHGFRREPNSLAFWAATEAFLSAHIGGEYQPVDPEEIKGTTMVVKEGIWGIPGFMDLKKKMP
jgi:dipeptidyl aminopeptidase/acylaminoacyl peptidase